MTAESARQSFAAAVARLHAALAELANGDPAAIKALYAHSEDATSFYGWGGYEKGWAAVEQRWTWAGQQFRGGTVSHRNLTTVVTPALAYTTDIETFEARMHGMDRPTRWSNRVTRSSPNGPVPRGTARLSCGTARTRTRLLPST